VNRYLIEVDHPAEKRSCIEAIRRIVEEGSHYVTHAEWGCLDDVHTGWIIVEADGPEEARMVLPSADRPRARVVRLTRFTVEELQRMLAHHDE
jgi:hypothetical protein